MVYITMCPRCGIGQTLNNGLCYYCANGIIGKKAREKEDERLFEERWKRMPHFCKKCGRYHVIREDGECPPISNKMIGGNS